MKKHVATNTDICRVNHLPRSQPPAVRRCPGVDTVSVNGLRKMRMRWRQTVAGGRRRGLLGVCFVVGIVVYGTLLNLGTVNLTERYLFRG